jgi:hypothetical protein
MGTFQEIQYIYFYAMYLHFFTSSVIEHSRVYTYPTPYGYFAGMMVMSLLLAQHYVITSSARVYNVTGNLENHDT